MIQGRLLLKILGVIVAYVSLSILTRILKDEGRKAFLDLVMTSVLFVGLIWKFGPALSHPMDLIRNPLVVLLTASGSSSSLILGCVVAIIYFLSRLQKRSLSFHRTLDYLAIGSLAYLTVTNLTWKYGRETKLPWGISVHSSSYRYHPVNIYMLIVVLAIVGWIFLRKVRIGEGKIAADGLIIFGIGSMIVSYFVPQYLFLLGLSTQQVVDLILIIVGRRLIPDYETSPPEIEEEEIVTSKDI